MLLFSIVGYVRYSVQQTIEDIVSTLRSFCDMRVMMRVINHALRASNDPSLAPSLHKVVFYRPFP